MYNKILVHLKEFGPFYIVQLSHFIKLSVIGVGKVKQTKQSSLPKFQSKNGTNFYMDTKKQKYKTIGPCIQFMGSWIQNLNNFDIIKVG